MPKIEYVEREFAPATLRDLITGEIEEVIDRDKWDAVETKELEAQARLKLVADNWQRVMNFLDNGNKPKRR